jgi:hypothetical protein
MKYDLTAAQRDRLLDLLQDQRDGVSSGEISGYGQTKEYELEDIDALISELEDRV